MLGKHPHIAHSLFSFFFKKQICFIIITIIIIINNTTTNYYFFMFVSLRWVSLCSTGWLWTIYVDQTSLKLAEFCLLLLHKSWD